MLEASPSLGGDLLVAYFVLAARTSFQSSLMRLVRTLVDVALNHDTHDGILAFRDLFGQLGSNLGLVLVVLQRVSVAAVHHETLADALAPESGLGLGDAGGVVVGALGASAKNDEAVLVAISSDNGYNTGLGDGKEVVGVSDSADGVNGDAERAVGAVLEADRETETARQLTVQLAFGGSGTNGAH